MDTTRQQRVFQECETIRAKLQLTKTKFYGALGLNIHSLYHYEHCKASMPVKFIINCNFAFGEQRTAFQLTTPAELALKQTPGESPSEDLQNLKTTWQAVEQDQTAKNALTAKNTSAATTSSAPKRPVKQPATAYDLTAVIAKLKENLRLLGWLPTPFFKFLGFSNLLGSWEKRLAAGETFTPESKIFAYLYTIFQEKCFYPKNKAGKKLLGKFQQKLPVRVKELKKQWQEIRDSQITVPAPKTIKANKAKSQEIPPPAPPQAPIIPIIGQADDPVQPNTTLQSIITCLQKAGFRPKEIIFLKF